MHRIALAVGLVYSGQRCDSLRAAGDEFLAQRIPPLDLFARYYLLHFVYHGEEGG
jgi:hypothetical protein